MSSLSARLLISVSVLLLLFFGATVIVLDTAFRTAGEQARRDILDGHLMQLLAAANPNDQGALSFPPDLHEERFNSIGSGLYGELRDDSGQLVWRSRSALGLEIPQGGFPRLGTRFFERDSNVIEVFIGRLRKKLDPENSLKPIETLRGRGYRFALERKQSD